MTIPLNKNNQILAQVIDKKVAEHQLLLYIKIIYFNSC